MSSRTISSRTMSSSNYEQQNYEQQQLSAAATISSSNYERILISWFWCVPATRQQLQLSTLIGLVVFIMQLIVAPQRPHPPPTKPPQATVESRRSTDRQVI